MHPVPRLPDPAMSAATNSHRLPDPAMSANEAATRTSAGTATIGHERQFGRYRIRPCRPPTTPAHQRGRVADFLLCASSGAAMIVALGFHDHYELWTSADLSLDLISVDHRSISIQQSS